MFLVDLDPQASASFWMDTREDDGLAITAIPASRLGHVLVAANGEGADIAIIDTPPFAKDIAFEAAQHADLVLIPTRPAVLDVMAMRRTIDLIKVFAKPSAVVLTFCPPAGKEAVRLDLLSCPPCLLGARVGDPSPNPHRTQRSTQCVNGSRGVGKAALEIEALYRYTLTHIYHR